MAEPESGDGRCVFGIDGGGSSTRLRVADRDNHGLLEMTGPGINPNALEGRVVADRLVSLLTEALTRLGAAEHAGPVSPDRFAAGCIAAAGMDRPGEQKEIEVILRDRLGFRCPLVLVSDPEAALVGGLGRPEGIILIAGTGSIAMARLADGRRLRAGGYGHLLGDEGSAFFIGFQALRRGIRSLEGRDLPTAFTADLFRQFGLAGAQDAIPFVYRRFDKAFIAQAAALIAGYRDRGDPLALDIYRESAAELVGLAGAVLAAGAQALPAPGLVLWGGLFEHDPWLKAAVTDELRRRHPRLSVLPARHSAAYGACLLALERSAIDT